MSSSLVRAIAQIDNIETHTFLPDGLGPDSIVLDLGANCGRFSTKIADRYGLRTFGVEANPALYSNLKSIEASRPDGRVRFVHAAISDKDEPVRLHVSGEIETSSIASSAVPDAQGEAIVPGKTLPTFLREMGIDRVDLLKCDIEGAEVGMFRTTPDDVLGRIGQITIEFHDHHRFMSVADFEEIRDRLFRVGFSGIKFSPNNTNWLFYRREMSGPVRDVYMRHIVRNARGVLRRMGWRND